MDTATPTQTLSTAARRLGQIAEELGLDDLARTIELDTRRRLDEGTVRAVALGEIKQGKTTLVNALLGREALPTGVTPTTGAVVVVRAGDVVGPFVVGPDGSRSALAPDVFAARARGPAAGSATAASDSDEWLELVVERAVLPPGLELVDTPGVNDIATYRAAVARGELPRADILVVVLDATQLLNRAAMAFLRDALAAVGGLDDSGAKLLVVVNRIDLVAEHEREQLSAYLARELAAVATSRAGAAYELFMTDARGAMRTPTADAHGIAEVRRLRARLHELAATRAQALPARARASLVRHAVLLAHNAAVAAHGLGLEHEALRREIKAVEHELAEHELDMTQIRELLAGARETILRDSNERVVKFRAQLQTSVLGVIAVASQRILASLLPGALHDAFVAFGHEESERLREALDEITRRAILTHSEQVRRRLFHATLRLGFRGPTIYLDPPSLALEAGLVAIGVAGTLVMYLGNLVAGMVMTVAGPLATVFLRERSLREARERARAELPTALERASAAFDDTIRRVVDGHLAALDEHLQLANVALGEQLVAVLRRAAEQLAPSDRPTGAESSAGRRSEALERLHALERELGEIRERLAAG